MTIPDVIEEYTAPSGKVKLKVDYMYHPTRRNVRWIETGVCSIPFEEAEFFELLELLNEYAVLQVEPKPDKKTPTWSYFAGSAGLGIIVGFIANLLV